MLSKAFTLAVDEWEWLLHKPFLKISREKENNEKEKYLTADEEETLLGYCIEWLKDLVVFALNTGLRQNEQLSLTWSRVSLSRKNILIQKTKNSKPKTVPLNQIAMDVILRKSEQKVRRLNNDFVFVSSHGTKIDRHNLRRAFK